jgi:coproporphyrinogen III oxidase-like Fe-S oxidoreductase
MLGMRTAGGVPERLCGGDEDLLREFETLGLLERRACRINLTPEGMLVSNAIITRLMDHARCA